MDVPLIVGMNCSTCYNQYMHQSILTLFRNAIFCSSLVICGLPDTLLLCCSGLNPSTPLFVTFPVVPFGAILPTPLELESCLLWALTLPLIRSAGDVLICFKCVLLVVVDMIITRPRWPLLGRERRWGPISTESIVINDALYREIKSIWRVWDEETRSGDGWMLWLSVQEMAMVPCYSLRPGWMGIWNREHSRARQRKVCQSTITPVLSLLFIDAVPFYFLESITFLKIARISLKRVRWRWYWSVMKRIAATIHCSLRLFDICRNTNGSWVIRVGYVSIADGACCNWPAYPWDRRAVSTLSNS